MFSLLSHLYTTYLTPPPSTLLILGLDSSGKTTLLEALKQLHSSSSGQAQLNPDQIRPTVGVNCVKLDHPLSKVTAYDPSGAPASRSLWSHYYEDCSAIIFVLDSGEVDRAEEVSLVYGSVMGEVGRGKGGVPVAVFANKRDLAGERHALTKLDLEDILPADSRRTVRYFEGSAREACGSEKGTGRGGGEEVRAMMEWVVREGVRKKR